MIPTEVQDIPMTLEVASSAFGPDGAIPKQHAGEGRDLSPPIVWRNIPEAAQEFAVICDDPDAPRERPFVHWIVYKIPFGKERLAEGHVGDALQGVNDFGRQGYGGPMPPRGHGVHHYHFKVYALDKQLDVEPGLGKDELLDAMEGHIVAWGELVGTYERR